MKRLIKKLFLWVFQSKLDELDKEMELLKSTRARCEMYESTLKSVLGNIDVSIDVHQEKHRYSHSWAVVSLQGQTSDFIKFIDLGDREIREISSFLRRYDQINHVKIDAAPHITGFLKMERTHNTRSKYRK